jgi:hypothetical protein
LAKRAFIIIIIREELGRVALQMQQSDMLLAVTAKTNRQRSEKNRKLLEKKKDRSEKNRDRSVKNRERSVKNRERSPPAKVGPKVGGQYYPQLPTPLL